MDKVCERLNCGGVLLHDRLHDLLGLLASLCLYLAEDVVLLSPHVLQSFCETTTHLISLICHHFVDALEELEDLVSVGLLLLLQSQSTSATLGDDLELWNIPVP